MVWFSRSSSSFSLRLWSWVRVVMTINEVIVAVTGNVPEGSLHREIYFVALLREVVLGCGLVSLKAV